MKKLILAIFLSLGLITSASAAGLSIGVSISAGQIEADNASEKFTGAHSSSASPGDVTKKASDEGDEIEGMFTEGSIFVELAFNDRIAVGMDYHPAEISSETAENITNQANGLEVDAQATNTVQVDFEDLTTIYAKLNLNENIYVKVGHTTVDVITNENLGTGGSYGDTDLSGTEVAIGYNYNFDTAFVRLEGFSIEMDGATLTNANDSTKSVSADGIDAIGARLSLGKSF